jgi:hypothetical protein
MTGRTPSARTTGYSVVLPPGWVQIPLDETAGPAVRRLLDRAFSEVPPGVPPDTVASLRRRLEGHLTATVADARRTGGTELYVPTERLGGVLVPASFVVADVRPETDGAPDDEVELVGRVVARLVAADDSARVVEMDGAPAVRMESRSASDPDRSLGVRAASRRVEYLLAVPGEAGRWLAVSATVLEAEDDDEDLAGLLVELFDAVMTTFRWGAR